MRKVIFWTTVLSGAIAAFLLLKRGVPIGEVAQDVIQHPIGTLVDEVRS